MRVLHYYPSDQPLIGSHVKLLTDNMGTSAECHMATEADQALTLLSGGNYDLLHLHGCWRNSSRTVVAQALRSGARVVVTPHGQLEPWIRQDHRWKEKLPKQLFYQRSIISKAYAIVTHGPMEQKCMEQLGWNSRIVVIRNCVTTHSITPQKMATQTVALYRRIMDSAPLQLMTEDSQAALKNILKAGITGDKRWLGDEDSNRIGGRDIQWRELLHYANLEHIEPTVTKGIRLLNLDAPDVDADSIECFLPDDYVAPDSIESAIGMQFATENDRLMATFRHVRKLVADHQLSIRHLVELDKELRQHDCEEQQLEDTLRERRLLPLARRLMQLMSLRTGLTDGFMPVPPLADRTTRRMLRMVDERLRI